jgi:tetratricopeptide (TPR) repeat protein
MNSLGRGILTDPAREELSKAKTLLKEGEYERAYENIQSLLAQQEDTLITLQTLILKEEVAWRLGKLDEGQNAVKEVEKLFSTEFSHVDEDQGLQRTKGSHFSHAGVIYWYRGDLDRALEYHQKSLQLREKLNDKSGILRALNNLGLVYWSKGKLDDAMDFYQRSLSICEETNDQGGLSRVLNNLANISSAQGNLDEALEYHKRSLSLKEEIAGKQDVALSLINIGVIYRLKGDLGQAVEYYNRSLALQEHHNIGPEFALVLNNLGEIYTLKGELDHALEFYQRSLLIYEDMGNKEGIALTLVNIGEIYGRKGNREIAFDYYRRSLFNAEEIGNTRLIASALSEIVWLSLDYEDYQVAETYFSKLEIINRESASAIISQQYHVSKALLLKKKGHSKERLRAEEILEQVVGEEIADHTLTVKAMIHLCDLLITELKATGDEEILKRINSLTEQLLTIAREQSSHSLVV